MSELKIGVIGTGIMGKQLSEYFIQNDLSVVLKTRSIENTNNLIERIQKRLSKTLDENTVKEKIKLLAVTEKYEDLKKCDLIIESSKEDMGVKKEIFENLSKVISKSTVVATNTSSLSIEKLSEYVIDPNRFVGCHFFNPVSKMKLVETVCCSKTDVCTQNFISKMCADLGKTAIVIKDSPGFIVNRLLLPQINEAVRIIDTGISTAEDIDTAVSLGLNHPMGPLSLADYIGIDTCVAILNVLYEETKDDHYLPANGLKEKLSQGHLGRKTGIGFYTYSK